jgi:nucleotide-binding universal stress UspA family protein
MIAQNPSRTLNLLLAFDGSQHAQAAIEMLSDLHLSQESRVTILGVLVPRESSNHARLQAALDQAKEMLFEKGISTSVEMTLGYPAEIIMQYAQERKVDLIAIGAKGLRATLGILLGGVAQQVIEYADHPVLIVRAPYSGLRRILLVTDGSPASQLAVEYLAGTTHSRGKLHCQRFPFSTEVDFHVMHVLPPLPSIDLMARAMPISPEMLPPIPPDRETEAAWIKEEEIEGQALLDQTIDFLRNCSGIQAEPVLARGDAATEIIQYVKEQEVNLIIAGSRGLTSMQSWLLGSVSRKLVHYSACSVLIVKGPRLPAPS